MVHLDNLLLDHPFFYSYHVHTYQDQDMDFESFNRWIETRLKSHHRGFYHPDVIINRTRVFANELFRQLIGRSLSDAARRRIILKRKIEAAKAEAQGTRLAEPSSQLFLELILFAKNVFSKNCIRMQTPLLEIS